MHRSFRIAAALGALVLGSAHAAPAPAPEQAPARCHLGAYRLDDGALVDIGAVSDPAKLRWRLVDGRSGLLERSGSGWRSSLGWTGRDDGIAIAFGDCAQQRIRFDGRDGRKRTFDVTETRFAGNGVELRGRLVLPPGEDKVPIAVLMHGSEDYSGVDLYHAQHLFPAHGIGVFVFDKRGTGGSGGTYTQDFHLLSDDGAAALREARRLAGARAGRVGFNGGSQAGWVAPLAASKSDADFVVVGYGLAISALGEDREQVMLDLTRAGYGAEVLAKAREVTEATGAVVASRGARGWDRLEAVRAKYGEEPWWAAIKGEFSGMVLQHSRAELEAMAPKVEKGTSWDYEPLPVLRELDVPLLWILAGADREAPPGETRGRLRALIEQGRPITLAEFPDTDHGMLEFETDDAGERRFTRITDGYFRMQIDWMKTGRLAHPPYGRAEITSPRGGAE